MSARSRAVGCTRLLQAGRSRSGGLDGRGGRAKVLVGSGKCVASWCRRHVGIGQGEGLLELPGRRRGCHCGSQRCRRHGRPSCGPGWAGHAGCRANGRGREFGGPTALRPPHEPSNRLHHTPRRLLRHKCPQSSNSWTSTSRAPTCSAPVPSSGTGCPSFPRE